MPGVCSGPSRRNGYRLHIVTDIVADRQHAKKAYKGQPTAFLLLLHNQVKTDRLRDGRPRRRLVSSRHCKGIGAGWRTRRINSTPART